MKLVDRIKGRIVSDWREMWKRWSLQLKVLGALVMAASEALGTSWQQLPPDLRAYIPHANTIGLSLFVMGIVASFIRQGKKDG